MPIKLSITCPTYNEAENVPALIAALETALAGHDYEIIIADDDSPDRTWERVEEIGRQNPRVRSLRRTVDRGLSRAVVDGFGAATGDLIACIDADLQHDPAVLPQMLRALEDGADLVVASRYTEGGGTGDWDWLRRFESWVATKMAHWLLGIDLRDPMSGYFMLRKSDFLRVRDQLDTDGFKILLEIAVRMKPRSLREVPFTFRPRRSGESKLSASVVYAYLRQLWRLSWLGRLLPTEMVKFGLVGASGTVVNLIAMALILQLTTYRDWRASGMASLIATFTNYFLNNLWTFRDRSHRGVIFVRKYISYLAVSMVGLAVTTLAFAGLSGGMARLLYYDNGGPKLPTLALLGCQLGAILVGMGVNFTLNKLFTWPHPEKS